MDVQAIIFDKDGTLMKFDSFWVGVSRCAVTDILQQLGREDIPVNRLLEALGVAGDTADIDGLLCKGTYEQIGLAIGEILREYGVDVSDTDIVNMSEIYFEMADETVFAVENYSEYRKKILLEDMAEMSLWQLFITQAKQKLRNC